KNEALMAASEGGHASTVGFLLDKGADFNCELGPWEDTPLQAASKAGKFEAATLLLQRGAEVSAQNIRGEDAFWFALTFGYVAIVRLILGVGFGVDLAVGEGNTLETPSLSGAKMDVDLPDGGDNLTSSTEFPSVPPFFL